MIKAILPEQSVFVICGSRGFIGSNLVRCLKARGCDCIEVHHDELSEERIRNLLGSGQTKPIVLYLMAWSTADRDSPFIQLNSVSFILKSMQVFSRFKLQRVIYAGTIHEFEYIERSCRTANFLTPNVYSVSKLYGRVLLNAYCKQNNIPLVTGSITNVYGPGEQNQRLVVSTLRKIMHQEHLEFSDGCQLYDFIYIADAVRDFVSLGFEGLAFDHYVVGSGNFRPLREYLEELCRYFDINEDKYRTFRPWRGDICSGIRLMDKERCVCKFFNQNDRVDFVQGIKKTYEWLERKEADENH